MYRFEKERGAALIFVFIVFVGLSAVALAFLTMVNYEIISAGTRLQNMQAFYVAEAGRAKARWALTAGEEDVGWDETAEPFGAGKGTYIVSTAYSDAPTNEHVTITSEGYIPDNTDPITKRRVVEADIAISSGELTNLSLDATISASSEKLPPNPKENANDGDGSSSWKADDEGDAWLKLDFGSSTTFNRVVYDGSNINSCTIESSNDDSVYTEVASAIESPVNFDPVEARYLRFNMDVNSNKTAEVNELETYDTSEEVSMTLGQGEFSTSW